MDNFTIRRADSLDVKRIAELRLLSQKHFEKSNPSIWRITEEGKKLLKQKVENDMANCNVQILLAEADGEIIGYAQGEVTCRNDYAPRTVGQISLVFVLKHFRRKGVGTRLMEELCKFFNANKAEYLTVRYIIGNKEAGEFWRKLGFESIITTSTTCLNELNLKLKVITS